MDVEGASGQSCADFDGASTATIDGAGSALAMYLYSTAQGKTSRLGSRVTYLGLSRARREVKRRFLFVECIGLVRVVCHCDDSDEVDIGSRWVRAVHLT